MSEPLLSLRGVVKRFGAVTALRGVDLDVAAGEVVALVGDNGAGKSTLVKVISGAHRPDAGEIRFAGVPVHIGSPESATALGIATVYQDLALAENLDVVANLFLGRELALSPLARRLRRLDEPRMQRQAGETIGRLGIRLPSLRQPVTTLSGGQRQAVAVARAVLWGSKLVLLDEPTAALGVEQTAIVLKLVRTLAEHGLGVLLISHNLANVFAVADQIAVLRLGANAGSFERRAATSEAVVAAITGSAAIAVPGSFV